MAERDLKINVDKWLETNKDQFLPPVCNKLMHNEQLSVMFVGGPNSRRDYHIEVDEELFLMVKGDMCVKIVEEGNRHRDIVIREGEMWRLPARIPHSPQRNADTVGLVIERRRTLSEIDGLRYYKYDENSTDILYQKWMNVQDLGKDLIPVIKGFLCSEECKTGVPDPNLDCSSPYEIDETTIPVGPFNFKKFVSENIEKAEKDPENGMEIFPDGNLNVRLFGCGDTVNRDSEDVPGEGFKGEQWIWQRETSSVLEFQDEVVELKKGDSFLVVVGRKVKSWKRSAGTVAIVISLPGFE